MQLLFPTPFINLQLNKDDLSKVKVEASLALGKYGVESPEGWISNSYGTFKDPDHNIIFKPEMNFTKDAIGSCISMFCDEIEVDYKNLIIGDSWLNKYEKGMGQEIHNHVRFTWSFILFITVPEGTPPVLFYNPYRAQMASPSPLDRPIMEVPPTEGLFILFPSYVDHSVPTQMTTQAKISLAGNIFYDSTPRSSIITG
ncbi:MAG: putative 2OG-Fe(II) oxygenase [Nitrososphaeraceae archaeon]|nr:putative 2OG-Fe(II) oxygenase [Nitrososphaeraceae archaeon]